MTENNAIERCDMLINGLSIDNSTNNAFKEEGKDYPTFATMKEFAKTCKKAIEKVQAFEEIGTIDEFKALKEKSDKELLIELPCKIGDLVWTWKYPTKIKDDGSEWTVCDIKRAEIVSKVFNLLMLHKIGDLYFLTKEEAERALEKRQGN